MNDATKVTHTEVAASSEGMLSSMGEEVPPMSSPFALISSVVAPPSSPTQA